MDTICEQNTEVSCNINNKSEVSKPAKRVTPLSRLIELRSKGLAIKEISAITGDSEDAIYQRFSRAGLSSQELLDYRDTKARQHEALQFRIHSSVSEHDIKKAPLGTKVLAICQLEDKIRLLQDQSTQNIAVNQVVSDIDSELEKIRSEKLQLAQELGIDSVDNHE